MEINTVELAEQLAADIGKQEHDAKKAASDILMLQGTLECVAIFEKYFVWKGLEQKLAKPSDLECVKEFELKQTLQKVRDVVYGLPANPDFDPIFTLIDEQLEGKN